MAKTNKTLGVLEQVRVASGNPAALSMGASLGSVVPVLSFWACHFELDFSAPWYKTAVSLVIIMGALMVSAVTVWKWTSTAFRSAFKATGFVVLVELEMLHTHTMAVALLCLAVLIGINAIAAGCNLALDDKADHDAAAVKAEKLARAKARRLEKVTLSGAAANDNARAKARRSA